MKYISFLIVILPIAATGQTITVSPTSVPLWGVTEGYSHIGIEYKDIGIHYFHAERNEFAFPMKFEKNPDPNIGISYVPIEAGILNLGIIAFPRKFPEFGGTNFNLWIEFSIPVDRFSLRYIHISNAYRGDVNPGVDMLSLSYSF